MAYNGNIDIEDLDIVGLAALSQNIDGNNPQKAEVEKAVWKKIEAVAGRIEKLNPEDAKELGAFQSLLENLPASYRMELGAKLDTVKSAETRLYRAQNGLDDRTAGEKAKDGITDAAENIKEGFNEFGQEVKNGYNKKKTQLKRNYNVGKRFARMAVNKKKNQAKDWVKNKKQSYDNAVDRMDARIDKWVNNAGQALENIENGIRAIPKKIKEGAANVYGQARQSYLNAKERERLRREKARQRRKEQWNKFKNGVKKFGAGVGKYAAQTAKAVAMTAYAGYRFAKWGGQMVGKAWNAGKSIINGIKLPEVKAKSPNEKSTLLDMANGNLAALKPEQVKNLYNELKQYRDTARGNKYGDAYYQVSAFSTRFLNDVKSGEVQISDKNAEQIAAWLEINKNIQEEVNKNRAAEHNDRNSEIEKMLKPFTAKEETREEVKPHEVKIEEPKKEEAREEKPKEEIKPRAEEKTKEEPKKDIYAGLNLSDEQKKAAEERFATFKDIFSHPEENGLNSAERRDTVVSMYKESLKNNGFSDVQINEVISRQKEDVKDNPQLKDMFREKNVLREQARENLGIINNQEGVDRLAEKPDPRKLQELRGVVEPKQTKKVKMDTDSRKNANSNTTESPTPQFDAWKRRQSERA